MTIGVRISGIINDINCVFSYSIAINYHAFCKRTHSNNPIR